jgi:hypothetical protein
MSNFIVSPSALVFSKVTVQGPIPGLYASAATKTFTLTNNSGASVTLTNYGFSSSTEGDAVTLPAGPLSNSDFKVVPTAASFPITIANGSSHSFTVTYAPLRRGSGFGDVRSAILTLFAGNKVITNGGQVLNSMGEVINEREPIPVTVGVGGGVIEEGYDWATVHPIFWTGGTIPAGDSGIANNVQGMTPNMNLGDLDTEAHYGPMLFWTTFQTGAQTSATTPRAPAQGTTGGYNGVTYVQPTPYDYGTPRGGKGYQILVFFNTTTTSGVIDDSLSFDLTISAQTNAGTVALVTFPQVSYANSSNLFVGGAEGLDLQGLTLVAVTSNFKTNGSTYNTTSAYNVGAVRTN